MFVEPLILLLIVLLKERLQRPHGDSFIQLVHKSAVLFPRLYWFAPFRLVRLALVSERQPRWSGKFRILCRKDLPNKNKRYRASI